MSRNIYIKIVSAHLHQYRVDRQTEYAINLEDTVSPETISR